MTESADMHNARFLEPPRPVIREVRLLDQVRAAIRYRHYSFRTEQVYVEWIRRYVLFHGKRHPSEMAEAEVVAFLKYLATERDVSAATHQQALSALLPLPQCAHDRTAMAWRNRAPKKPRRLPAMVYTHVLNRGGRGVLSPLDRND